MKIPIYCAVPATATTIPRVGEPVVFGVPMPRGAVLDAGHWSIGDGCERRLADASIIDRWGDGSVRWLLIDTQLPTIRGADEALTFDLRPVAPDAIPATTHGVSVEVRGDGVRVETGVMNATIRPGDAFPFGLLEMDGRSPTDSERSGLRLTDRSGQTLQVHVGRVALEHEGRLRIRVRTDAEVAVGGRRLELVARLDFFAGQRTIRVRCTLRNPDRARHPGNFWDLGDAGSILFKDCSLALSWATSVTPTAVKVSLEPGVAPQPVSLPFELYQDSSGGEHWQSTNHINRERKVPNTFRGYRLRSGGDESRGHRATPAVAVHVDGGSVGVVVPAFWQNFPRAIEVDAASVCVRLFPGQYGDLHELQGGEQKTHECFVTFGPDVTGSDYDWCRAPTVVCAAPEWTCATGAVDGLAPLDQGHTALVSQAIEGPDSFERKREIIDEFGWRHFGEIYGDHEALGHTVPAPLVSHYNNQYDPILGFGLQYLRTGDPRWRLAMDELAGHVIDIDIYHTDRDKAAYNGGLFWHTYHYGDADTATHRTYPRRNNGKVFGGGPSADHNYPTGLMLRYFLTGDAASREAAVGLAQYVINLDDGRLSPFRFLSTADTGRSIFTPPDYYGPSRSSGNSLNALVDGHRLTGEPAFLEKADQLVRRVVHPHEDPARNRLDDPEYRWFYAMFLQALGKYLAHKADRGLIDDAYAHGRASLLNYARWMAEHEYPYLEKPEKLEFPTETWAAQDIRKSDILYYAAIHSSGDERSRFAERAAYFHRTAVETLGRMPTRVFARPVIVLLTSGFLHSWYLAHPSASLPRPALEPDVGPPVPFVSQRTIAERRAKLFVLAGVIAGAAALAALFALVR